MMRGSASTLGSGINKIISRHFTTVINDEYNTSKKCCNCGCDVENLYMPITNKESGKVEKKKIHRLMRCKTCISQSQEKLELKLNITSSESRKLAKNLRVIFNGDYLTRDKNSCINMLNITKAWIYTKTRPTEYQRPKKFEIPNILL